MNLIIQYNNIIWGGFLAAALILTGFIFTLRMNVPQISCISEISRSVKKDSASGKGEISGFAALCAALGGQIGTGSLVGVASALASGGPGSLFWMWVTAIFGMAIAFSEAVLAQLYHEKNADGNYYGGPAYYMSKGLNNGTLARMYALTAIVVIGIFVTMLQNNSIAAAVTGVFDIPSWIPGIIATIIAAIITIGGVRRLTDVASYIVPFMSVVYLGISLIIIFSHISLVPSVIADIFKSAFTGRAATGGVAGYTIMAAIRNGTARGIFSNDAGIGTAAEIHASAKVTHPARQGFSAMFGTFFTTIVICSCTGFCILLTGSLDSALTGASLAEEAFFRATGQLGKYFVMAATVLFCFNPLVADIFHGEVGLRYLLINRKRLIFPVIIAYRIIVLILIAIGSILSLNTLWNLVDFGLSFMVFINLYAMIRLFKYVKYVFDDYCHKKTVQNGQL